MIEIVGPKPRQGAPVTGKFATRDELARAVVFWRGEGLTFREIGRETGVSSQTALYIYNKRKP